MAPNALEDGAVRGKNLAEEAVTQSKLAKKAVGPDALDDGAVRGKHLADEAVTRSKLGKRAVGPDALDDGAVRSNHVADGAMTKSKIALGAVSKEHFAPKSVGKEALDDNAIGAQQIAAGAINNLHLAPQAVQSAQIAQNAVQAAHIALQAVQTAHIAPQAVQSAQIANGSVVKRINGLSDNVTIMAGPNISITPSGNILSISAPSLIGGAGTAGRLARWTSANAIAASGITESGANIGIGTASPIEKLHIDGTGVVRARINSDTNAGVRLTLRNQAQWSVASVEAIFCATVCVLSRDFQIYSEQAGKNALYISEGSLNISTGGGVTTGGSVTPTNDNAYFLGSQSRRWGAVFATNGTIQTSDARLKQGIKNLGYGLSDVMRLRPVTYKWKEGGDARTHLGLIAQEVEQIIPEAIEKGITQDAPLGMNYTSLVPVLIKAVQEQQAEIASRDTQINALRRQLAELAARIKAIEQARR